jgi:hypothetical protein
MVDPGNSLCPSPVAFFIVGAVVGTRVGVGLGVGVGVGIFLGLGAIGSARVEGSEGGVNDCDACSFARRFNLI